MIKEEKKKLKSLIGFLSVNKIDKYSKGGKRVGGRKKNAEIFTEQFKK